MSTYVKDVIEPHKRMIDAIREQMHITQPEFFAGLFSINLPYDVKQNEPIRFAISQEGVGTKILISQLARKFKNIGIDVVAMNVNDIICLGATPVAFSDYIALPKNFPDQYFKELFEGMIEGADLAGVRIPSGETPIIPDMLNGVSPELAYDLAGGSIGVILNKPIYGREIKENDVIVGLKSNGLHCNGFTLARETLLKYFAKPDRTCANYEIDDIFELTGETVWKELLRPTKIYVREINFAVQNLSVHGLAHITGQAFQKLNRLTNFANCGFIIENLPEPPAIMTKIKNVRKISVKEMYSTFNMGIGFCVVLPKAEADDLISICKERDSEAIQIGKVTKKFQKGIKINLKDEEINL